MCGPAEAGRRSERLQFMSPLQGSNRILALTQGFALGWDMPPLQGYTARSPRKVLTFASDHIGTSCRATFRATVVRCGMRPSASLRE